MFHGYGFLPHYRLSRFLLSCHKIHLIEVQMPPNTIYEEFYFFEVGNYGTCRVQTKIQRLLLISPTRMKRWIFDRMSIEFRRVKRSWAGMVMKYDVAGKEQERKNGGTTLSLRGGRLQMWLGKRREDDTLEWRWPRRHRDTHSRWRRESPRGVRETEYNMPSRSWPGSITEALWLRWCPSSGCINWMITTCSHTEAFFLHIGHISPAIWESGMYETYHIRSIWDMLHIMKRPWKYWLWRHHTKILGCSSRSLFASLISKHLSPNTSTCPQVQATRAHTRTR